MRKRNIFVLLICLAVFLFTLNAYAVNGVGTTGEGKCEMRGVWIASVGNINFPSQPGLDAQSLMAELDSIIQNVKSVGLNAVFFQVRPSADSLYLSDIFPTSAYLTGVQGKEQAQGFDPLAYMLQACHQNGIELHAWINPYRVSNNSTSLDVLADNNPAKLHPEYVVAYDDGKLYFNPGLPEVRQLIVDGVCEVLNKYPAINGIHFDDYFYPYPVGNAEFNDIATYEASGSTLSLADWRRQNVNTLIKDTYNAIKAINPDCRFGVSPFGIYANNGSPTPVKGSETNGLESYISLYCDPVSWANEGIVDYLAPQIYWQFSTSSSAYDTLCRWWNANLDGTGVDLYIGHAAYKASDYATNEIPIQVDFARNLLTYKGSVFYGYSDLVQNTKNMADGLRKLYEQNIYYTNAVSTGESVQINYPENGTKQSVSATYLLGSSDPAYPVEYAGSKISRTKDGYFSLFSNLNYGKNYFQLLQNGKETTFTYNCTVNRKNALNFETLPAFEISECIPSTAQSYNYGDVIEFSCVAPSGSTVTAVIGGMSANLKPTLNAPHSENDVYYKEIYTGSVKPGKFASEQKSADLGSLKFKAQLGEKVATKTIGLIKQNPINDNYTAPPQNNDNQNQQSQQVQLFDGAYAQVINDYSHLKISSSSSFYDDYRPVNSGMRDYITEQTKDHLKLSFGGWVEKKNVAVVNGTRLYNNYLLFGKMKVDCTNTLSRNGNTTDIVLGVTENVPTNVNYSDGKLLWTIYNTKTSVIPKIETVNNPLIKDISGKASGNDKVIYTITLKEKENYYGFDVKYQNGALCLSLNNPVALNYNGLPLEGKTIVVDGGHGGTDVGAMGPSDVKTGLHEADLNLSIALALGKQLEALGAKVIMTRSEDVTLSLAERIEILAEEYPDMAISIHHNSLPQTTNPLKIRGFLGLYTDHSGYLLTKTVSQTVCSDLARYERDFYVEKLAVTRNHRFPSMLCEMSYVTSAEEFQWSLLPENIEKSGKAVANGIVEYYKAQEKYLEY